MCSGFTFYLYRNEKASLIIQQHKSTHLILLIFGIFYHCGLEQVMIIMQLLRVFPILLIRPQRMAMAEALVLILKKNKTSVNPVFTKTKGWGLREFSY